MLRTAPEALDPTVHQILSAAEGYSAQAAFEAEYRRASLARTIGELLSPLTAMLVPTTPTTYRVAEVMADPLRTNSRLGTYTNFTNLADLCAIAVPGCFRADGLPAGLTFLAPAFRESQLATLAAQVQQELALPAGATGRAWLSLPVQPVAADTPPASLLPATPCATVAVLGAHLRGMPLNHQLTERGATFVAEARTTPRYRLYALAGGPPKKPGIVRVSQAGVPIALELWDMPLSELGGFLAEIPSPLGLGKIELENGHWVTGFICEPWGTEGAEDISTFGGFRAYLQAQAQQQGS